MCLWVCVHVCGGVCVYASVTHTVELMMRG